MALSVCKGNAWGTYNCEGQFWCRCAIISVGHWPDSFTKTIADRGRSSTSWTHLANGRSSVKDKGLQRQDFGARGEARYNPLSLTSTNLFTNTRGKEFLGMSTPRRLILTAMGIVIFVVLIMHVIFDYSFPCPVEPPGETRSMRCESTLKHYIRDERTPCDQSYSPESHVVLRKPLKLPLRISPSPSHSLKTSRTA